MHIIQIMNQCSCNSHFECNRTHAQTDFSYMYFVYCLWHVLVILIRCSCTFSYDSHGNAFHSQRKSFFVAVVAVVGASAISVTVCGNTNCYLQRQSRMLFTSAIHLCMCLDAFILFHAHAGHSISWFLWMNCLSKRIWCTTEIIDIQLFYYVPNISSHIQINAIHNQFWGRCHAMPSMLEI